VRVFKTKRFSRFAREEDISDRMLIEAIREVDKGLSCSNLGGDLIKKRIARKGQGKRGGYRVIIVYRAGDRAIFLYGFPKNAKPSLNAEELEVYKKVARIYLSFAPAGITKALREGELEEVEINAEEI
jgi:hypothetical protein